MLPWVLSWGLEASASQEMLPQMLSWGLAQGAPLGSELPVWLPHLPHSVEILTADSVATVRMGDACAVASGPLNLIVTRAISIQAWALEDWIHQVQL